MFAEATAINFNKTAPMVFFFSDHRAEDVGSRWIIRFEVLGQVGVDPGVFLFLRDGEGQDFLFAEAIEGTHS